MSTAVSTKQFMRSAFVLLTLLLSVLPLAVSAQVESGGIAARPAKPRQDEPRSSSIFIHTLDAGKKISEAISVSNTSGTSKKLRVYATDAAIASGGAFTCAQHDDPKTEVGTWVDMSKEELSLDAGGTQQIDFLITVPQAATPGQHDGCIVTEEVKIADSSQSGVTIQTRNAIRVSITVPGDLVRKLSIANFTIDRSGEQPLLALTVNNEGNVDVDFFMHVVTRNILGQGVFNDGGHHTALSSRMSTFNHPVPDSFWGGWLTTTSLIEVDQTGFSNSSSQTLSEDELKKLRGEDFDPDLEAGQEHTWDPAKELSIKGPEVTYFVSPHPWAIVIYIVSLAALFYIVWFAIHRSRTHSKKPKTKAKTGHKK